MREQSSNTDNKLEDIFLIRLKEREKELRCLYGFAEIIERKNIGLADIFTDLCNLIPSAMSHPAKTSTMMIIDKRKYKSEGYKEYQHKIVKEVKLDRVDIGTLEVSCSKKSLPHLMNPFLKEEDDLLQYIAERLGRVVQRHTIDSELRKTKSLLEANNKILTNKNIALSEFLNRFSEEKRKETDRIKSNIETILLPLLTKMKEDNGLKPYAKIIASSLNDLTTSFGSTINKEYNELTPREIEICCLLKNRMSTKDISEFLSVSPQTINKHRVNIRRKFGIAGKKKNIVVFLQSL